MNEPPKPEIFDGPLRWWVRSRSNPKERYLVQLDAYDGNGTCQCRDFTTRFEKFLKRGYTAELTFAEGWIRELRPWQLNSEDCLRCFHVLEARQAFCSLSVSTVAKHENQKAAPSKTPDAEERPF